MARNKLAGSEGNQKVNWRSTLAARWDTSAYLFLGALLIVGAGASWLYGDDHKHYNGLLVLLGWVLLAAGWWIFKVKPPSHTIASGFAAHKGKIFLCMLLAFGLYGYLGELLIYIAPSMTYGYAWKYGISMSKVLINPQPHDCEWQTAPIGNKNCHYEARVQSVRTSIATDGTTPLVSYDEGKTWQTNAEHEEPSVRVWWNKISE